MLKRTPLFSAHQRLGARLIDFGGWEMPVQYSSIVDEHLAVRKAAGLFDISHMGEIAINGPGAESFLNQVLTNDLGKLKSGQGQYSLMCNERGGVVDDLYVYRLDDQRYLLVVNASRIEADWDWIQGQFDKTNVADGIQISNASGQFAALALQGPRVSEFMDECVRGGTISGTFVDRATELKKNELGEFIFSGTPVYVARTGYSGEDGFEVIAPAEAIEAVWNRVLAAGHACCLQPAGLGARDTLRTEMCYPLYGRELDEETTPLEAGLGFFVSLDKGEFIGRSVLAEQKERGLPKKCVAFKMIEKSAPPRPGYAVWSRGESAAAIGKVVSGTQSPSLNVGIGMAYLPPGFSKPGTEIEVEIRGRKAPAAVVAKPIYRKS